MLRNSLLAVVAAGALSIGQAQAIPVDAELVLLVDTSTSVDSTEFQQQRDGWADAFKSNPVKNFVEQLGSQGSGIAVSLIFFSGFTQVGLGWTELNSATDSDMFGDAIAALSRPSNAQPQNGGIAGNTNIANGVVVARDSILNNGFEGNRLLIDVSGDGAQDRKLDNTNGSAMSGTCFDDGDLQTAVVECQELMKQVSNDTAALGISINGLAIANEQPDLLDWYTSYLITPGGFALPGTFGDFQDAAERKLVRELVGTPEPATLALFAGAVAAAGVLRRRA